MKRKIILGLGAAGTALAMLPLFAAFEAHVINVTAKIENALAVSTNLIDFGTVFPQEHLEKPLGIQLSDSFIAEGRVDDVEYFIRQKPKCGWTLNGGTNLLGLPTATGHVIPGVVIPLPPYATQFDGYYVQCPDPGNPQRPNGSVYGVLPSLCGYISKESNEDEGGEEEENDGSTPSFHKPFTVENGVITWHDTYGRLAKSEQNTQDNWIIDLAVPCFGGYCAQDWLKFVRDMSDDQSLTQAEADYYTQPIENQHKIFGCNLWVEVRGVSESGDRLIISESNDFTMGGVDIGAPELSSTAIATTTYAYGLNTTWSGDSSIPTVQWRITVDGPAVGLAVGDVHIDELGWEDISPDSNIETFHYPMSDLGNDLRAIGSCTTAAPHSDACGVDDFDVDPNDNFNNVNSIHFSGDAPLGIYNIRHVLVDTETDAVLSNEFVVTVELTS